MKVLNPKTELLLIARVLAFPPLRTRPAVCRRLICSKSFQEPRARYLAHYAVLADFDLDRLNKDMEHMLAWADWWRAFRRYVEKLKHKAIA